jgi:hypothetical protein
MNDVNTYSNLLSQRRISHVFEENVTAWIIAIQNATIKCLNSTDEFEENRSFIQVKRMNAHDLQSETNDQLLFTEDAYEQSLDVVRLPIPIPQELAQTAPDFLFIRPDDIALFRSITNGQRSVLIGNPDTIYRKFAGEANLPNDNIVRSRVKEYGPFIRIALSPYLGIVREFGEKRDLEIFPAS